jgi:hypothetical protein
MNRRAPTSATKIPIARIIVPNFSAVATGDTFPCEENR